MVTAKRKYKLIMPGSQVVQKFYLDSDDTAYALQMYGSDGKDMMLCYGKINPNQTEIDFTGSGFKRTRLVNFGHGQTFEPFKDTTDDGKWAWVVTYAKSSTDEDSIHWATRVGVIPLIQLLI
ncbi:helveticin J family class III bacteriocin [Lentilactobacillus curieae]|uniref:helveticin J family class III bacteriocin n=1 Tax=Lentilactobacillus curieae TaxID=1138822 RepID=UPI000A67DD6A|nr:helveticin J family class III bacteriocin [Lentilactobacillus curieae]